MRVDTPTSQCPSLLPLAGFMDMVADIFGDRWKHVDERAQLDIRCSWEVSKVGGFGGGTTAVADAARGTPARPLHLLLLHLPLPQMNDRAEDVPFIDEGAGGASGGRDDLPQTSGVVIALLPAISAIQVWGGRMGWWGCLRDLRCPLSYHLDCMPIAQEHDEEPYSAKAFKADVDRYAQSVGLTGEGGLLLLSLPLLLLLLLTLPAPAMPVPQAPTASTRSARASCSSARALSPSSSTPSSRRCVGR